jgi:hypothetical protein
VIEKGIQMFQRCTGKLKARADSSKEALEVLRTTGLV